MIWKRARAIPQPPDLFDSTKIDLITRERTGVVSLIVVQDQPWTNAPDEIDSLVQKIRNYARFVSSGGLDAHSAGLAGAPWRILIDTYTGAPGEGVLDVLRELSDQLPAKAEGVVLHELDPPIPPATSPKSVQVRRLSRHGDETVEL